MITRFQIKNYRCIREGELFGIDQFQFPVLSPVTSIVGHEGTGKTSIIQALATLKKMIVRGYHNYSDPLNYQPFGFDEKMRDMPTEFLINFLIEGVHYSYSFAYFTDRIVLETLKILKDNNHIDVFSRKWSDEEGSYEWAFNHDHLDKTVISFIRGSTHPSVLYLSKAATDNCALCGKIRKYFNRTVEVLTKMPSERETVEYIKTNSGKEAVINFLRPYCPKLVNIKAIENDLTSKQYSMGVIGELQKFDLIPTHNVHLIKVEDSTCYGQMLDLRKDESTVVQSLFYLSSIILRTLKNGGVLVVDNLDEGLNARTLEMIYLLFNNNNSGSQLFATIRNLEHVQSGSRLTLC